MSGQPLDVLASEIVRASLAGPEPTEQALPRWPDPDAPRAAVDAFVHDHAVLFEARDAAKVFGPPHEAPEVENGPSIVCNACGIVRVALFTPFCKGCLAVMGPL